MVSLDYRDWQFPWIEKGISLRMFLLPAIIGADFHSISGLTCFTLLRMALAFLDNSFLLFPCFLLISSVSFIESNEITRRPPLFSALFVFGDSTVDAGNNDYLVTASRSNFPPYGRDFIDQKPTGRFSNGRLTTDFLGKFMNSHHTYYIVSMVINFPQ